MNTRNRRITGRFLAQTATEAVPAKEFEFGEILSGTFSIKIKEDPDDKNSKILYENKAEPFEYEKVNSIQNVLRHIGAKLDDNQIKFIGQALATEESGKATLKLVEIYNAKLKADAKSSAYQSLVNKYRPLEGDKKETAQAKIVAGFIKLAGVSKEIAVEQLRKAGALPEDYTVADFDSTPLRRTKTADNDSDE